MIPSRLRAAISLAVVLGVVPASSEAEGPVSATSSSSKPALRVGESAEVVVSVQVEAGWHINSHEPGLDFLIPTKLEFELPDGIRVQRLAVVPSEAEVPNCLGPVEATT